MKIFSKIVTLLLFLPAGVLAQDAARIETSGQFEAGVQQVGLSTNSSKFNEYRDIQNGFNLFRLRFEGVDVKTGGYLNLYGTNLIRDDQYIRFGLGSYGSWGLEVVRNETPHRLSNKAKTPYINQGNGLFTVPSPVLDAPIVGIPNNSANTADMLNNDKATAAWLATHLRETGLGTRRDKTSTSLRYSALDELNFNLTYADERKSGSKITYGPFGNRPPDILNTQFAEPIDYATREVTFELEYNRKRFQSIFKYLFSDFNNGINRLRWQNIWAYDPLNPLGFTQATSAGGSQRLAIFGQRALAPDNRYQNASLTIGADLPRASRLTATASASIGQDGSLIPYSSSDFGSAVTPFASTAVLPRTTADAEIVTRMFNLDYTINPADRCNLRAFYRYYGLDNNTTEDNWRYITSDAIPNADAIAGLPTFKNMRTNLAYAFNQQNYGLDATYRLAFWRSSLGLSLDHETVDRDYREADTDENILKASIRTLPAKQISLRAKYTISDREADGYNTFITAQSYWYTTEGGANKDNPKFSFTNHPDMRKFDVSDRKRQQFDVSATFTPLDMFDVIASYRFQDNNYDSNVKSTQPLLGNPLAATDADRAASTPGDQLGLLKMVTGRFALDVSYTASPRLTLSAFGSRETIESKQRGMEFQENNKLDAASNAALQTNVLGPWTRANSQWVTETDDRTNTIGAGAGFDIIPGKLNLTTDYTYSLGKVDTHYSGFGARSSLDLSQPLADNYQFAFRDPTSVSHKQHILNVTLDYQVIDNLVFGLHYLLDRFSISDWMQEADQPWFESVGSEFLLRDTSRSQQWGNRLVNMGSYLAPGYTAHLGSLTMTYNF